VTTPTTTRERPGPAPEAACAACPHPLTGHDAVALRYCRATVSSALDRGCIC
jgi:hypothetical protein